MVYDDGIDVMLFSDEWNNDVSYVLFHCLLINLDQSFLPCQMSHPFLISMSSSGFLLYSTYNSLGSCHVTMPVLTTPPTCRRAVI